jgi:biotin carboxylase
MVPPIMPDTDQASSLDLLKAVLGVWGNRISGVCHFEAKMTNRGPAPIELNLRIGGAETPTLVRHAYGVDFAHEALKIALHNNTTTSFTKLATSQGVLRCYCSSINIVPDWAGEGKLESMVVDKGILLDPAFAGMHIYFKQDDIVRCPPIGSSYLGWLVARGATHDEAEANLTRLLGFISYKLVHVRPATLV